MFDVSYALKYTTHVVLEIAVFLIEREAVLNQTTQSLTEILKFTYLHKLHIARS